MKKINILLILLVMFLLFSSNVIVAETISDGIKVIPKKETVFADKEGVWRYSLKLIPDGDYMVTLKKFISKGYTLDGKYIQAEIFNEEKLKKVGIYKLKPEKIETFNGGMANTSPIYFMDYIFIGIDENGNEVKGAARIHFIKLKEENRVGPFK